MICPHCRKEIEQQPITLFNPMVANGCNPHRVDLVFTNAAAANAFPATTINHLALNAAAGCNPFPQVTYIKI